MEIQKVYISRDNTAVIVCHNCGFSKKVNASKYKDRKDPVNIRCRCKSVFRVLFEFRNVYRKETRLHGKFSKLPKCKEWGSMTVKNISQTGIGFATLTIHNLKKGDEIKVRFTLDDKQRSEVEKDAVVRVVNDKFIGCEFTEPVGYQDKALGFYLMP